MKEPTLKKVAYGIAMAIAAICVHFVNARVYPLSPIIALVFAIIITTVGIILLNKFKKLDKKISKTAYNLLNILVVVILMIAYIIIAS